jgi:hypothetical protein
MWVASEEGPVLTRLDPRSNSVAGSFVVAHQGPIRANQILAVADGALWLPLFDEARVVKVGIPVTQPSPRPTVSPSV